MNALIGYTGFVGKNLDKQYSFDLKYGSSTIEEIRGESFDVVVCSGISGTKWIANENPGQDAQNIERLKKELDTIRTKKFILISTVDVYNDPFDVDENSYINKELLHPYGRHRYLMELWVKEKFENHLIVRLPALFGFGLKKNFIFDLYNPIPNIITAAKWEELRGTLSKAEFRLVQGAFEEDINSNYVLQGTLDKFKVQQIQCIFEKINFSSLVFTDHRSRFQFYYLDNIWKDIEIALKNNIDLINFAVEPISAEEVAKKSCGIHLKHVIQGKTPVNYNVRSVYWKYYDGDRGYLYDKVKTQCFLKEFLSKQKVN